MGDPSRRFMGRSHHRGVERPSASPLSPQGQPISVTERSIDQDGVCTVLKALATSGPETFLPIAHLASEIAAH